jgi:hypothetical protein
MYDGPKSILGFPVQLDPDLIGQIQILERTKEVHIQLDSKL